MIDAAVVEAITTDLAAGRVDDAATGLVKAIGPAILGYLRSVVRDNDDADDAFARWAESVWTGLPQFRGEASLETWCYRIAWHAALRILRDPYLRRKSPLGDTDATRLAAHVRTSTASFMGTTAQDQFAQLRATLTPDEQTLLTLRLDRALGWRDIAAIMAEDGEVVSEASLRKRYERVKDRVRALAESSGMLVPRT